MSSKILDKCSLQSDSLLGPNTSTKQPWKRNSVSNVVYPDQPAHETFNSHAKACVLLNPLLCDRDTRERERWVRGER